MSNIVDKNLLLNKLKEISIQKKTINNFESIIKKQNLKLEKNNNIQDLSINIPIVEQKPVIIETAPIVEEQKIPIVEQKPVIIETVPIVEEQKIAIVEQKPVIIETAPIVEQKPVIIETVPIVEQKIAIVEQKPVIIETVPIVEEQKIAIVEQKPVIIETSPIVEQKPIIISDILPTINESNISNISSIEILNQDIENLDIQKILDIIQSIKEPISILEKYLKTNNIPIDINIEEVNNYINIYNKISKISNMEDITNITTQIQKTGCFQRLKNLIFKNIDEKTHQNIKEKKACFTFLFSKK